MLLFRKETERIEESRIVLRGWPGAALTWLEMISRLLTPAQRTTPGAFPEEDPSDAQVRIRRKGEGAEVKEIWLSYREVLEGDNVGYKSQLSSLILSQNPPLMRWGWAIYILGICTQGLNGHFS